MKKESHFRNMNTCAKAEALVPIYTATAPPPPSYANSNTGSKFTIVLKKMFVKAIPTLLICR
jgi:hypothetical protein